MCFSKKKGDELKIAKSPIICYKYFYKMKQLDWHSDRKEELCSPHYTFFWNTYKQYSSNLKKTNIKEFKDSVIYNKSLFSAFLKKPKSPMILDGYLYKCIIPKNSLYLVSINNELVTSNLIITSLERAERNTPEKIKERNEKDSKSKNNINKESYKDSKIKNFYINKKIFIRFK